MNLSWLPPLSGTTAAVANHLWQSTIFVFAIWLLTLLLRSNQARIRYALWLTASLKFLLPFYLLITLGSLLPQSRPAVDVPTETIYSAVDLATQPFAPWEPTPAAQLTRTSSELVAAYLPAVLFALWTVGSIAVLLPWYIRWRHLTATLRRAIPAHTGRELRLLRRVEAATSVRSPLPLRLSEELIEPGIFGILRPVLVWPRRLTEWLEDEHIEAILTHELMHVCRRDNLTAALHMLIEAAVWFHPIVWWIGRRLVDERERACDEAVVQLGGCPQAYAESLLKACRFCLESPLPCVSGITGADLNQRIRSIMAAAFAAKLTLSRKLLLIATAAGAIAGPLIFGQMATLSDSNVMARFMQEQPPLLPPPPPPRRGSNALPKPGSLPKFEVTSVRQNKTEVSPSNRPYTNFPVTGNAPNGDHFIARNFPVFFYLQFAYKDLSASQLQAVLKKLPDWASKERFDIEARANGSPSKDEMRMMMQSLLADRFGLMMHFETQQIPVYALTLLKAGKTGAKLRPHTVGPPCSVSPPSSPSSKMSPSPTWPPNCGVFMAHMIADGVFEVGSRDATMDQLANSISSFTAEVDRTVVNQTALSGTYDYTLQWTPEPGSSFLPPNAIVPPDAQKTTLLEALSDQLGLKLAPTKVDMQVPVIDHIEPPSQN